MVFSHNLEPGHAKMIMKAGTSWYNMRRRGAQPHSHPRRETDFKHHKYPDPPPQSSLLLATSAA